MHPVVYLSFIFPEQSPNLRLTAWNMVLPVKMIVAQLVQNLLPFLEYVGSLSCLKVRGQNASTLHESTTPWRRTESGAGASRVLNKGTRWKLVVSVTPRPFFPHRKSPGAYWVGLGAGVDSVVEGSLSYPYWEYGPVFRVCFIQNCYTDCTLSASLCSEGHQPVLFLS